MDNAPELVYVLCSWINDWEAGRFPAVVPAQSRFHTRDDAVAALRRHQLLLDAQAQESVSQINEGVRAGSLIGESGINVVNAVFGVPAGLVKLIDSTALEKDWPDDGWELTSDLMVSFLLDDGSYSISYEFGEGTCSLVGELDRIDDLERLIRESAKQP